MVADGLSVMLVHWITSGLTRDLCCDFFCRVFAAEMVRKMLLTCEGNRTHFDLALAKEAHAANPQSKWLVVAVVAIRTRGRYVSICSQFQYS